VSLVTDDSIYTLSESYGRGYVIGNKTYPSITTVVGIRNEEYIQKWKEKVGQEEADRVSKRATTKGTMVHLLVEHYIENQLLPPCSNMLATLAFQSIQPVLKRRLNNIVCQEVPLFSHKLRLAGRVDCIAEFDGVLSIIDFKTASKQKEEEWIENYFIQETAYAIMFEEMTGIAIEQIVTVIAVDHDTPQVFIKKPVYRKELIETRKEFYKRHGI
jgi:genome maintenance exonuclease 1